MAENPAIADPADPAAADPPERRFGWSDMFAHPDEDPDTDGGFKAEVEPSA